MGANNSFKDSVFVSYFSDREKLIETYNAIEGKDYPKDTDVSIETLSDALFLDRVNDVAFLLGGRLVVLMEHQFTPNENMPLRMLLYVGRVYERLIESRSIYRQKLVKIPKPEFIVLYNGEKDCPDRSALSLSDAFLGEGGGTAPVLDLKVKVYNVNYGRNPEILRKSKSLSDYAAFISRVRGNRAGGAALGAALREAIRYCVDHGIMREYLEANGSEVENMLFTEFNMDEAIQVWKEEGREEGIEEGIEKGKLEDALNLIKEGVPLEVIARATGLPYGKLADLPCGDQI